MEPKKLYTVNWTQAYNLQGVSLTELEAMMEQCIEEIIEAGDLHEARQELTRIMAL